MSKYIDLAGQQFGCWKVLEKDSSIKSPGAYWKCQCIKCNKTIKSIRTDALRNGVNRSCGCEYDLTGKKFGKLTVLELVSERTKNGGKKYKCQCDCGNIKIVPRTRLISGESQSCGCLYSKNLIGEKFGRLTVLEQLPERKNKKIIWKCQCDCGNIINVASIYLKKGNTKSCGCLKKDWIDEHTIDLTNQVFGKLTVLSKAQGRKWTCQCDCGTIVDIPSYHLRKGLTQSCGCIQSRGEEEIKILLNQNHINFVQEKTFDNCINPKSNYKLRYDFYLLDYKRLIEFDGKQHFYYSGTGWDTREKFEKTQVHDKIKNEYALFHNIDLVRIPYWERNKITLDMILGDKYLITS